MRLALLLLLIVGPLPGQDGVNWPSFRGPNASGVAEGPPPPVSWDVEKGAGVKWKTPIPGLGHSSPVIWKDRIFLTTAVDTKKKATLKVGLYGSVEPAHDDSAQTWKVLCLDKQTGRTIWEKTARQGEPRSPRHPKATQANPTVAVDGTHVVACFGSEGLYCYDFDGELLWEKDLGVLDAGFFIAPKAQWGYSASPVIHDGKLIIQVDVLREQYLAALDVTDGSAIWRTKRDDYPTWSTPGVWSGEGPAQVVTNGFKHIGGYDLDTGKELWRMKGGGDIPVPSPIFGQGMVFISNAHGGAAPVYAVKLHARGDISLKTGESANEYIAWSIGRGGSYLSTPILYGDYLYVCRNNGVLSCYTARTGKRHYQRRLGEGTTGFTSSMVASNGKLYVSSEDGDVYVLKAGPEFELLATNRLGEVCMATPAISEGVLYYRTRGHLVAIRK